MYLDFIAGWKWQPTQRGDDCDSPIIAVRLNFVQSGPVAGQPTLVAVAAGAERRQRPAGAARLAAAARKSALPLRRQRQDRRCHPRFV